MEANEYAAMAQLESTMWWYRALHAKILCTLRQHLSAVPDASLLDAGCGTGGMLAEIQTAFPSYKLHGIDISDLAVVHARQKSRAEILQGNVMHMPYSAASFDVIISTDVLYHRLVEPQGMLEECCRVLRPGGFLIFNLPAYQWLRSYHDEQVQTARRYTLGSVQELLGTHPLRRVYGSYWNMLLFLPLVVRRKLLPAKTGHSDVGEFPAWLDAIAYTLMSWENAWMCRGSRLPFGSSVFTIYVKTA